MADQYRKMSFLEELRDKAKAKPGKIVLPEGDDRRVQEAAEYISKNKIAEPIVLKSGDKIDRLDEMIDGYAGIRRLHKKVMSKDEIRDLFSKKSVYAAAMMVRMDMADGFVAGVAHETADVARAALHCLNLDRNIRVMSGGFVMEIPDSKYGQEGTFIFSDCGIVPYPKKRQLAGIAVSAARFAEKVLKVKPKVAMLSYSTKGSATMPNLDVIKEVVSMVRESDPDIDIDGELQVDAALDPKAAHIKDSVYGSDVAGHANVLIFPNLDSGNIAYKLTQRLAKARAVGPVLLGLEKPCSDLSRACFTDDIIDAVAVINVMAQ
jgi:phosphate acetyltransferase